MTTYSIKYTDINKAPITIAEGDLNTSNSITLFGRIKPEYGELLNENLLHLLENFACPEDLTFPGTPDLSIALDNTLTNPPSGKIWYNSTKKIPYIWDGTIWNPLGTIADYAANSGKILHNQQLPLPISSLGKEFSYQECIWVVSPSGVSESEIGSNGFSYMVCTVTDTGLVNHQYTINGSNELVSGVANYIIIGIKGNNNIGENIPPPQAPPMNVTPTSTVTPTLTPSVGVSVTPTQTPSQTVTPTVTPTRVASVTPSPTRAPSVTPSPSPLAPISALVYLDPSTGISNDFGVANSYANCTRSASNSCLKNFGVWVANISGGMGPPYTVRWNLMIQLNSFYRFASQGRIFLREATAPPVAVSPISSSNQLFGNINAYQQNIIATVTGILGGPGLNTTAFVKSNYTGEFEPGPNSIGYSIGHSLLGGSNVTIHDSSYTGNPLSGNPLTLYTPVGNSPGQVPGLALTEPPFNDGFSFYAYSNAYLINI